MDGVRDQELATDFGRIDADTPRGTVLAIPNWAEGLMRNLLSAS